MRKNILLSLFLAFSIISVLTTGCSEKKFQQVTYNHDTDVYIESISPFSIGRMDPIAVSFTQEPIDKMENAIEISTGQKGEWKYSGRQAVFTPAEPYEGGGQIILSVDCKKLFGASYDDSTYRHEFAVKNPDYKVNFDNIKIDGKTGRFIISGTLTTDIQEPKDTIEEILSATENGKKKEVEWSESVQDSAAWAFTIPVENGDKEKSLEITWNGKKMGVSSELDKMLSGSKKINFPKKGEFAVLDIRNTKNNSISVSFSEPLNEQQDIHSLISFYDKDEDRTISIDSDKFKSYIDGNVLTVYSDRSWGESTEVVFNKGIESKDGTLLERSASIPVSGEWEKPAIMFANEGIILPSSQGTILPVQTLNLQGLLIQAYAIENRNMNQFLQVNELDGANELYRVGEPVWEKKVFFKWDDSQKDQYITRGLDLTELVNKYPDGMFQIRVSFRHDQIMYHCNSGHRDFSKIPMPPDTLADDAKKESSWWDYYNDMDYEVRSTFWYYDNDPCHPAYYMPRYNSRCLITRNILVTDLAMMAKLSASGKYYVTVTDMKSAKPVKGADVTLSSFTGKTLASAKTDENGNASFSKSESEKAYVITASDGSSTTFLKISGGTMLSTSHFEVGGEVADNGVKGAIYAERGVWRPGDDIYLTFVLQDLAKTLPKNVPVNFTLTNPLGTVSDSQVLTESENGFYAVKTKTFEDSTTGNWNAKIKIGGKEWNKSLKIETVIPNRLAVNLETDAKYLTDEGNTFTVSGSWLHGAPVPGYNADVSVMFTAAGTSFDKYSDYTFVNPERTVVSDRRIIWSGKLDSSSKATFEKDLYAGNNLPGKLKANFITRIFEPSNAFSTQTKSMDYSPYQEYVGLKLPKGDEARNMLLTDTKHTADLVLLDAEGNTVESGSVDWSIYKLNWKWWWEKDAYTNATYVSSYYNEKIDSESAEIKNGRGSFKFEVKYPDWGRYFVVAKDSKGHSTGKIVYIDWPGWAGRAQESGSGSASMVALVTDKKKYTVGETAEVTFSANKTARALVTIEKAGEVYKQEWIEPNDGSTAYRLPITADMAPNVYVHISLIQPHGQTENSLPIRLYGVVPVMVDDPGTKLSPVITVPKTFQPNGKATISVSEKNGRPMTYTLAVVDEGLLGLTNFHSANLRGEFYKKEASTLQSWDLYKYVMSAYSGKLETLLAIGGSEDIKANDENDENRFKPVVRFFGPYTIQAGEKKPTTFTMPEYIGAVRAMVVAGYEGAYGTTEKTVEVKSDIMVQTTLPRTLGTDEEILVPVTLFNNTDEQQSTTVRLDASGAVSFSKSEKTALKANETKTMFFKVATKTPGTASFKAEVTNGISSAKAETEVEVKSRGIPVSYKTDFTVKAGKTENVSVTSPTEKGTTELTAEISTYPQLSLESRLSYLTGYPHGCIEQITSGGFPQIYIPEFVKLSKEQIENIKSNVNSVIDRYPKYQTNAKTFGYWPGSQTTHEWGTCYASHFMIEARNHGYSVPYSMLQDAVSHIKKAASEWTEDDSRASASVQAYRLFVLALYGEQNLSAMNRLLMSDSLGGDSALLLAAGYAKIGRADTAKEILGKHKESDRFERFMDDDFSSSTRERAIALFTYNLAGESEKAENSAKKIAETLASDKWLSTQETAWSLFSLIPFYTAKSKVQAAYEIEANGKKTGQEIPGGAVVEKLEAADRATQEISISNKGERTIFGTLTVRGMSKAGTETEKNDGIRMSVAGLQGITEKKAGDSVRIEIQISNTSGKDLKNMALTLPVPTGFEFTNERLASGSEAKGCSYQDIRDDAIYTYFDLARGESVTFSFDATLAYEGDYVIPAIHAEAMYDNDISAIFPGIRKTMAKQAAE